MAKMVPVESLQHAGKGWRPQGGYAFAAAQALVPLSLVEFGKAAVAMPVAFLESSGRYIPVAVTSPIEGRNLFVSATGQWLGSYVPAALRSYPFRLGKAEGRSGTFLLVDEDSGWVTDADEHAQRFFEEDGSPSAALKSIIQLLQELDQAWALTNLAVAALAEADLIRPWPLTATIGNQQVTATGLYRVDEAALGAVDEQMLMKLRKTSSLAAAYAQIISAHTVDLLRTLDMAQQHMSVQQNPAPHPLEAFRMNSGEALKF